MDASSAASSASSASSDRGVWKLQGYQVLEAPGFSLLVLKVIIKCSICGEKMVIAVLAYHLMHTHARAPFLDGFEDVVLAYLPDEEQERSRSDDEESDTSAGEEESDDTIGDEESDGGEESESISEVSSIEGTEGRGDDDSFSSDGTLTTIDYSKSTIRQLKSEIWQRGIDVPDYCSKDELIAILQKAQSEGDN